MAHARAEAPAECCGMLVGRDASIDEAVQAKNIGAGPTRFLVDPKDHIDARRAARRRGLEVLGFYHSHPHSPAWPFWPLPIDALNIAAISRRSRIDFLDPIWRSPNLIICFFIAANLWQLE